MKKHLKYLYITIVLSALFLLPNIALAIPTIGFSGDVHFDADSGVLTMGSGVVSRLEDVTGSSIATFDHVFFSATWDGSNAFINGTLEIGNSGQYISGLGLTLGTFSFSPALTPILGDISGLSGTLSGLFSPVSFFDAAITDPSIPLQPDFFTQDFNATLTGSIEALPTPIPAAGTLMGVGIMMLAGFRRTKGYLNT